MKTNVVVESSDRELFGVKVRQHIIGGWLSLSDLEEAYTRYRVINSLPEKNTIRIMNDNSEALFYILEKQGLINIPMSLFMENIETIGFAKYMKSIGAYKTTGARHTKTVWANPYIVVMVAMEMSQYFKSEVVYWVTDALIMNRIEAGNFYKELAAAVTIFHDVDYKKMAKGLNYCIFGKHESGLRNTATARQLKDMYDLESKMAFAINMGYIKSFGKFLDELRSVYNDRKYKNIIS